MHRPQQLVEKRRVSLWLAPFSTAFTGKRDAYPTFFNRLLGRVALIAIAATLSLPFFCLSLSVYLLCPGWKKIDRKREAEKWLHEAPGSTGKSVYPPACARQLLRFAVLADAWGWCSVPLAKLNRIQTRIDRFWDRH